MYSYQTKSHPSAVGRPVEVGFWAYETLDAQVWWPWPQILHISP
jgi:hypothetical protein